MASLDSISAPGAATGVTARPGVLARLARNKSALIGGGLVLVFVLMALLAPILPLADPFKSTGSARTSSAATRSPGCSSGRRPRCSPASSRS